MHKLSNRSITVLEQLTGSKVASSSKAESRTSVHPEPNLIILKALKLIDFRIDRPAHVHQFKTMSYGAIDSSK
ncbi:hypothetical protein T11_9556 [Trichinella zimbabwensis]|uniref:Uncharacterized protein n=1 Tax=Trichinella zimbabwensis TaxID=268475 RepID=A0A0V1I8E1_9BILA|nr:hypothetical protein T11_9556 [Trichinella zimbabwensis]